MNLVFGSVTSGDGGKFNFRNGRAHALGGKSCVTTHHMGRDQKHGADSDGNGQLTSNDSVVFGGLNTYLSGVQSTIGITPTPTIVKSAGTSGGSAGSASVILGTAHTSMATGGSQLAYAISAGSSGANASTIVGLSSSGGRVSWRELQTD